MKQLMLVMMLLAAFSCKKDYTCTCNYKGLKQVHEIYNTKGNAEDKCNEFKSGGIDCTLEKKSK